MIDDLEKFKTKSIVSFLYLIEYNKLEKKIQRKLKETIPKVSNLDLNRLYFRYGGRISTTYNNDGDFIQLRQLEFKEQESFGALSISEIIELNEKSSIISELKFDLELLQSKFTVLTSYTCIKKLTKMRNKLAHNSSSYHFTDDTVIDLFSKENMTKFINSESRDELKEVKVELMDDETMKVASNLYYLIKINDLLSKE